MQKLKEHFLSIESPTSTDFLPLEWVGAEYLPRIRELEKRNTLAETKIARLETLLNQTLKGWDEKARNYRSDFRDLIFVDDYSWNKGGLKEININDLTLTEQIALDICHNYRKMMGNKIIVGLNTDFKTAGQNETLDNVLKTGKGSEIKKWFNHHGQKGVKTKQIKRAFDLLCKFGQPSNIRCDGGFALFEQATIREIEPRGLMWVKRDTGELGWEHTNKQERILIIGPRGGLFAGDGYDPRESFLTYPQLKAKYNRPEYETDLFQELTSIIEERKKRSTLKIRTERTARSGRPI